MQRFFILCCICVTFLYGCSFNDSNNSEIITLKPTEISSQDILEENGVGNAEQEEQEENSQDNGGKVPVNTTEEAYRTDTDGIRLARAACSIGNSLYFCQWEEENRESALYNLIIGSKVLQKVDTEISQGMNIHGIAANSVDEIYLLLRTKITDAQNTVSLIRMIDENGSVEQEVDITSVLQDKYALMQNFMVDKEGNFIIRGMASMIALNPNGEKIWEMTDAELGISDSYATTMTNDGFFYIAYCRDGTHYIGTINLKDGSISEEYSLSVLNGDDKILAIGEGTDSELLIYGNVSGCFAWNKYNNELEIRNPQGETNLPYNTTIKIRLFIEDGRLLIVENISEGSELVAYNYRYLPAGQ